MIYFFLHVVFQIKISYYLDPNLIRRSRIDIMWCWINVHLDTLSDAEELQFWSLGTTLFYITGHE